MSVNTNTQNELMSAQTQEIAMSPMTEAPITAQATTASDVRKSVLKRGSTGPEVTELQKLLNYWGYYCVIDGIFGSNTEQAVKGFQHRVFLPENGIVNSLTWQALYTGAPIKPILRLGSTGENVKIVQKVLSWNGYYNFKIDGDFGTITKVAVVNFQNTVNLPANGIVESRTWHALSKLPH